MFEVLFVVSFGALFGVLFAVFFGVLFGVLLVYCLVVFLWRHHHVKEKLFKRTQKSNCTTSTFYLTVILCLSGKRICSKANVECIFFIAPPVRSFGAAIVYSFVICSVTAF
jgi:ABC-type antimicrobial peptide transport system permease subunit